MKKSMLFKGFQGKLLFAIILTCILLIIIQGIYLYLPSYMWIISYNHLYFYREGANKGVNKIEILKDFTNGLRNAIRSMKISGNYLYAVTYVDDNNESVFLVYDISNPSVPKRIDNGLIFASDTGGASKGIEIQGNYAYVVSDSSINQDGLRIIDITNPRSPQIVGGKGLNIFTHCSALAVYGNYAYVGNIFGNLAIVDVSNPSKPILVSTLSGLMYSLWSVKVEGNYAYVGGRPDLTSDPDFEIIDISNKSSPSVVGSLDIFQEEGGVWTIDVVNSYAYVAGGPNLGNFSTEEKFHIVDISDPTNPTIVSSLGLYPGNIGAANYVKVYDKYAYITTWDPDAYNFFIVDISNAQNPTVMIPEWVGLWAVTLASKDRYVYIGLAPIPRNGIYLKLIEISE